MWRKTIGKVKVIRGKFLNHRGVAVKTSFTTVVSAYGPQKGDSLWLTKVLDWSQSLGEDVILLGDLNWYSRYRGLLGPAWHLAETGPPTTTAGTSPTRAIRWTAGPGEPPVLKTVDFVHGVPPHGLCKYVVPIVVPTRATTRFRHTAFFEPDRMAFVNDAKVNDIHELLDASHPLARADDSLSSKWRAWHARAEAGLQMTTARHWTRMSRKPERPKGSEPTSRPTAPPALHHLGESIAMRRLRRLHRRCSEQARQGVLVDLPVDAG